MPDYMFLLESRLSPEQRAVLMRMQELARAEEVNLYLAGGAVRDLISGMPLRDLDFTVEGNPSRILRELEKGGARIVSEDEKLRHAELIFAGDADGSIGAAREEVYERPGARPEIRWSTIMEDLRRRDFSVNAIAISLNANSRGLLLDPTNGLADLERREVRALSIHAFTNQPIRLLRALRYAARMGFKLEGRTAEWLDLALQRGLKESLQGTQVGEEIRHLGREDNPAATLKAWETHGLTEAIYPQMGRRRPNLDSLVRLSKVREAMMLAGVRPRLFAPVSYYVLERLSPRERASAMRYLGLRSAEVAAIDALLPDARRALKTLRSSKLAKPREAYDYLARLPLELMAFVQTEFPNPSALSKIRNYLQKWRPLRLGLPVSELDALGVARGPKFDQILEQFFTAQLKGKGRDPQERTKLLRKIAGIKEEPAKKIKPERKRERQKEKLETQGKTAKGKTAPAHPMPPPRVPLPAKPPATPLSAEPRRSAEAVGGRLAGNRATRAVTAPSAAKSKRRGSKRG